MKFLFQCFMINCLKKTMSQFIMYSHCRPKNFISLLIFYIFICGNLRHLRIYFYYLSLRASRRPSPRKFSENRVTDRTVAGKISSQGYSSMVSTP